MSAKKGLRNTSKTSSYFHTVAHSLQFPEAQRRSQALKILLDGHITHSDTTHWYFPKELSAGVKVHADLSPVTSLQFARRPWLTMCLFTGYYRLSWKRNRAIRSGSACCWRWGTRRKCRQGTRRKYRQHRLFYVDGIVCFM